MRGFQLVEGDSGTRGAVEGPGDHVQLLPRTGGPRGHDKGNMGSYSGMSVEKCPCGLEVQGFDGFGKGVTLVLRALPPLPSPSASPSSPLPRRRSGPYASLRGLLNQHYFSQMIDPIRDGRHNGLLSARSLYSNDRIPSAISARVERGPRRSDTCPRRFVLAQRC